MKVCRILALALVALAVVGAGCGGDDGGDKTTPKEKTPAGAAETSTVKLDEYSFEPESVTVKRGATIKVENEGAIEHNLTVEQGPDPKEKSQKLAGTSTFVGGKSENLEVDRKPGKYAMVCTVAGHRELGMVGTFTVK